MTDPVAFLRIDELPSLTSVPDDALVPVWSAGRLYAAPRSSVGGGGGGGSGGYATIQLAGVSLAQRDTLNVTGLLQATDSGGKTVLNLPAINLASADVSGLLPLSKWLGFVGTTNQSLRFKVDGSLEAYTPSAGLNAPASPGDNNKVAIASAGNLVYQLLVAANLSPAAAIALSQLAAMGAGRLLGRDTGSGAPVELTLGGGIEFTGTGGLQRSALTGDVTAGAGSGTTSISGLAVSKLAPGADYQQLTAIGGVTQWRTVPRLADGGFLTNANVTKTIADGSYFELPASTLAASAKKLTLSSAGLTINDRFTVVVVVFAQSQDYAIKDGGAVGDDFFTVLAGQKREVHATWNGTAWRFTSVGILA